MKIKNLFLALAFAGLFPLAAYAQLYTLSQTTLSAAISDGQTTFAVASLTGITVQTNTNATDIYIDRELMQVTAVNSTTDTVTVIRGVSGTQAAAHASGDMVLAGPPAAFINYDPEGACSGTAPTTPTMAVPAAPTINTRTGAQWLCSTVSGKWIPGFNNPGLSGTPQTESASVTGGTITPSGPLAQFTGTTELETINVPTGCGGNGSCSVTLIFSGSSSGLTWGTSGNIAAAGTATTTKSSVTFVWDATLSKWIPSRLA